MTRDRRRVTPAVLVLVLGLLLSALPGSATANVGAPTRGGQRAGEPTGIVDVAITRKELVIDLRKLPDDGPVTVAATYQLENRAGARRLDLVFASGADELVDLRISFDDRPLATRLLDGAILPASWQAPTETPLPGGGTLGFTLERANGTAGFQLDVPPGRHELAISYAARAMTHHARHPVLLHQFGYVLSPARTWAGFGGLDVTVHTPPGWIAAITPAMPRTGDALHATFTNIPADAIALTVHAPLGAYPILGIVSSILLALVILGGGVLVYLTAYRRQQRRAQAGEPCTRGPAAFVVGALWATAFLAAGVFAILGPDLALPEQQIDRRGYGDGFAVVFVVMLSPVVFGLGLGLGLRAGRRGHAAGSA